MIWPFLALILHDKFQLNDFQIGIFLSASLIIGVFCGFFAGNISDKIGRQKVIQTGIFINIISMLVMADTNNLSIFFIGALGQAIASSLIENPGKALMTDMLKNQEAKEMALHLRYFGINIGASIGPAVGIYLGFTGEQSTFYLVAIISLISFIIAFYIFSIEKVRVIIDEEKDYYFKYLFSILRQDHSFLLFIIANMLIFLCYAQMYVALLQYLRIEEVEDIKGLYANLMLVNGITIIVLQFFVIKLLKSIPALIKAVISVFLFVISFIMFAFLPANNEIAMISSVFILSLGEVILFPTINILIDKMAPKHLKGSYFGVAGLAIFGVALAPFVGGFMLEVFNGFVLWISMAIVSSFVAILFYKAQTAKRPESLKLEE
jgi:MFS family permease